MHQRTWFGYHIHRNNISYSFEECSIAQLEHPLLPFDSTIHSVTELLQAGYTVVQLRAADVPVSDLHTAGVAAHALLLAGYSGEELRDGGYSAHEMYQDSVSVQTLKLPAIPPQKSTGRWK